MIGNMMCIWTNIPKNWSDWGAFACIAQAIILLIALVWAIIQTREASKARKLSATVELLDQIGNEDIRLARGYVLKELGNKISNSDIEDKNKGPNIRRVAVAYDRVAFLVKQKLLDGEPLYKFQKDEIEIVWNKVGQALIEYEKVKGRLNYCRHFKWLAEEWLPEMKKKYGNMENRGY